jgi:hypothetical protein
MSDDKNEFTEWANDEFPTLEKETIEKSKALYELYLDKREQWRRSKGKLNSLPDGLKLTYDMHGEPIITSAKYFGSLLGVRVNRFTPDESREIADFIERCPECKKYKDAN